MNQIHYTSLLYAEPSAWDGYARVLDIAGTFDDFNDSDSAAEADGLALASDWYAVGADLLGAINRYGDQVDQVFTEDE